jgi:predicted TIM-barrel fold metal-dependent hydrolase
MVDVHTHVFPPRIGPRLAAAIGREFGREPAGDGSAEDLASHLAEAGLTHAVCFTAALRPDQMIPANSWMIALRRTHSHLIPLGTVHPGHPAWETELNRLERSGVAGLKIHPDLAGIPLNSPAWEPIWEAARGRFLVVVHMGPVRPGEPTLSHPMDLATVLKRHGGLEVVAPHLGGLGLWAETLEHLAGRDIYMDTSCCHDAIPVAALGALLERHDRGRILFGSDYPLFSPKTERPALAALLAKLRVPEHTILENGTALAKRLQHGGFAGPAPSPGIDIS